jgi:NTP pyrophosphatase (non-canonical NTP hydrolase)
MEEASELIQSISKLYRFGSSSERIAHLIEEMVDVLICFELLKILYNIPDELINLMIITKMKRNVERIDK